MHWQFAAALSECASIFQSPILLLLRGRRIKRFSSNNVAIPMTLHCCRCYIDIPCFPLRRRRPSQPPCWRRSPDWPLRKAASVAASGRRRSSSLEAARPPSALPFSRTRSSASAAAHSVLSPTKSSLQHVKTDRELMGNSGNEVISCLELVGGRPHDSTKACLRLQCLSL